MRPLIASLCLVAVLVAADADPAVRDLLIGAAAFVGVIVALVVLGETLGRRL